MLLDKLSLFNKAKFQIAKSISQIKQTNVSGFGEVDLLISTPKISTSLELVFGELVISNDFAFIAERIVYNDILKDFDFPKIEIVDNLAFVLPEISDLIEYKSLLKADVEIIDINFHFAKPLLKGKSFVKQKEKIQPNLFTGTSEEEVETKKENTSKIERKYTEKNQGEDFDIFDLIFPALQPPLGSSFDNTISFPYPLYPFQVEGVKFLHNNSKALLGDEMGLGKSIQTITASRFLFRKGKISTSCIICPKAVTSDWEMKLWEWAPELKVIKITGTKLNRQALWNTPSHFYICTYETLLRDFEFTSLKRNLEINDSGHSTICPNKECNKKLVSPYFLHYKSQECPFCKKSFIYPNNGDIAKTSFDLLVFDEIQKTKNPNAKLTKASRSLHANYIWALSGTPLENKIEDLISICQTINPNIFHNIDITKNSNIINALEPIFLRRRKEDVLKDLPPKLTKEVWLELLPSQRQKYDLAESQGIIDLEGKGDAVTIQHILALITKLKQICNYDPETKESVKLDYLEEELEELTEQGDKAIVFSQYPNETLKRILPHLSKYNPNIYDGSLSDLKRTTLVSDFQNNEESKVMLISLKAGNAGITLTRANYVYQFDLWWNPAVSAQAVDRTHRIGQTKTVFERLLLTDNTIERKIYNILADKKRLFDEVINGLNDTNVLTQTMSEEEIFGLFGLKKSKPINKTKLSNTDFNLLSPLEFEHFIGELFTKMGYYAKVTKQSNDGGIDVIAKLQTPTSIDEVIIQCKHKQDPMANVDIVKVRELLGVLSSNRKLAKAILVTNGKFTNGAKDFANNNGIELIDGIKLKYYVEKYK
jgi:SNF2 family DNA or RNA helicase